MNWHPILTGDDAAIAEEHVADIAEGLRGLLSRDALGLSSSPRALADLSIFFEYSGRCSGSGDDRALADQCLDDAVNALAETHLTAALHGGFCGIAWAAEYVSQGRPEQEDSDDLNADIDEVLIDQLQASPWQADYDLIKGLVGFGAYFSGRLHRDTARDGLRLVVERLEESHTRSAGGLSWHTEPMLLPPIQRDLNPDGYFNVGVAHGVPGILVILSIALSHGILPDLSRHLLEGLVAWLEAIRQDVEEVGSSFPSWWMPGREPSVSRQAWCYGDPGVGATWLWAAMLAERQDWADGALRVLRRCAEVPLRASGVEDAGLCHGAVGLGHIYNRVYQATGEPAFREAAVTWLRRGFPFRSDEVEPTWGYRVYGPQGSNGQRLAGKDPWQNVHGLLVGSIGVGLGYLSALSGTPPDWDRLLLLSVPPKRASSPQHPDGTMFEGLPDGTAPQ